MASGSWRIRAFEIGVWLLRTILFFLIAIPCVGPGEILAANDWAAKCYQDPTPAISIQSGHRLRCAGDTDLAAGFAHRHAESLAKEFRKAFGIGRGECASDVKGLERSVVDHDALGIVSVELLRHIRQRRVIEHQFALGPRHGGGDVRPDRPWRCIDYFGCQRQLLSSAEEDRKIRRATLTRRFGDGR
jgi:hypothetical protein